VSRFHHVIAARLFPRQQLNKDSLLAYDQNIVRHTQTISARREEPLRWKYFQYLGLLFVKGRSKPASRGRIKTSQFEER
jgi:hypothetical protein